MTGLTDAVKYCCDRIDSNQTLFVSDSLAAPYGRFFKKDLKPLVYVYSLFYGKIDPWSYQHGGFSNTFVQTYSTVQIDQPCLLLRCNYRPFLEGTNVVIIPNNEAVPVRAKLLATFQDRAPYNYQVFEIK